MKSNSFKTRIMSFLMAFMLFFGMAVQSAPLAYAKGTTTTTTTPKTAASSIFDIVGDDGAIADNDITGANSEGSFQIVISKYKSIAVALMGVLTITMLIFMLIQFTKLGAAGDNEMARKKAIMGILTTGIATALLGGSTIVVGFFWGALNGADSSGGGTGG